MVEAVQSVDRPVRGVTDPGVITTRQAITPAGVQSVFDGRVYGVTFGASASELWVLTGRTRAGKAQLYRLDWLKNAVGGRWELEGAPALQGLAFDPERKIAARRPDRAAARGEQPRRRRGPAAAARRRRCLRRRWPHDLRPPPRPALAGGPRWHGPAAAPSCRWCSRTRWRSSMRRRAGSTGRVKTGGVAPFGAVISRDGRSAWVSNWGGRWPKDGDSTLPTGLAADRRSRRRRRARHRRRPAR